MPQRIPSKRRCQACQKYIKITDPVVAQRGDPFHPWCAPIVDIKGKDLFPTLKMAYEKREVIG